MQEPVFNLRGGILPLVPRKVGVLVAKGGVDGAGATEGAVSALVAKGGVGGARTSEGGVL